MTTLRDLGVATVNVEFSGGNDEGGADAITYLDASGSQVAVDTPNAQAYEGNEYDPDTKNWKSTGWIVASWGDGEDRKYTTRPATPDEIRAAELRKVLEAPIYDRYGSFAGEFSVYGTLTWDVATSTNEMHGQESYSEWNEF